jgi:hypothetical protein
MIAYRDDQRFCSRACSDQWFQEERRQAVEFFRALGMRPELRNGEQQKEAWASEGECGKWQTNKGTKMTDPDRFDELLAQIREEMETRRMKERAGNAQ